MSNLIEPVLTRTDLCSISSKVGYSVIQGGQNITQQAFAASSSSPTNHIYNINVPSTDTVMSRNLKWRATVQITLAGTIPRQVPASGGAAAVPGRFLNYGQTCVLNAFPLNASCITAAASINNTTFSVNTREVQDVLCRMLPREQLGEWNATTPTYLDNYANYLDSYSQQNSPFQAFGNAFDARYPPRAAFPVSITPGPGTASLVNISNVDIPATAILTFDVVEPLIGLSPFVWGTEAASEACGLNQLSNILLNMTMDQTLARSICFNPLADPPVVPPGGGAAQGGTCPDIRVQSVNYTNCFIDCEFQTPGQQMFLPETCTVPYMNIQNYATPSTSNNTITSGANVSLISNNITLSSVPDKLLIFVRKNIGSQTSTDATRYATIKSVSLLFSNQSGILASAPQTQLFKFSQESDSKQTWLEFSGVAGVGNNADCTQSTLATCGSVLALDFASVIPVSDLKTCGSLGQFNIQATVQVQNFGPDMLLPTLNLCFLSSGVAMFSAGTAVSYTGLLDRDATAAAYEQKYVPKAELKRMVGGGFFDRVKAIAHKAMKNVKHYGPAALALAHQAGMLDNKKHSAGRHALKALEHVGFGDVEGGAMSGGRRLKHRLH